MFRFRFTDARTWRYMVASIEKIIDEGVFVASPEGLSLRALDTSRVAMVDLYYPQDSFKEYEVEEETEFGVSFPLLSKVLRRARKDDELELKIEGSYIEIIFHGRGTRRFKIPQITLSYEKLPEPKISYTVTARLLGSTFREVVRTIEPLADAIVFEAGEGGDKLYVRGEGDIEKAELILSMERGSLLDLEVESPDRSMYTLEYFSEMIQAAQAANMTVVRYSMDAPIRVDMEYQEGGRLTFYVSPRIE
ncbi:MAG: proliferating cell nuclear antigen (pcna) [Desulfurococcales archaeon]|nr:proliferating cell nuclear antigen (pcna) [Desulfurococcales archaeon]